MRSNKITRKLSKAEVEKLGKTFGCQLETELCMSFVGLIDCQVQNTFIIHNGKRYFVGLTNVTGPLRLWDWETGLAADIDWIKAFQCVSGVAGIVQQSLWESEASL